MRTQNRLMSGKPELSPEQLQQRRMRITAVLVVIAAVLVLIALLSHTEQDADNAQLSLRDLMGVIRGDSAMRVRFDTTHNWLGLLGAVLSHWLFHSTIGWFAVVFPALAIVIARDLYRVQAVAPLTLRRTAFTVAAATTSAAIVGTAQLTEFFAWIPAVWSGAIGQFFSGVLVQFIGRTGSFVSLVSILGFIGVFGFGINPARIAVRSRLLVARVRDFYASITTQRQSDDATNDVDEDVPEQTAIDEDVLDLRPRRASATSGADEPAELLRRATKPSPPQSEVSRDLASGVRIVRSIPRVADDAEAAVDKSAAQVEPAVERLDLGDVERKLRALHPNKDIRLQPDTMPRTRQGKADDNDVPAAIRRGVVDAPLTDDTDEPSRFKTGADVERNAEYATIERVTEPSLIVHVEETPLPEVEHSLPSFTLYDENIAFKPPTEALLVPSSDDVVVDDTELQRNAAILQEKLETFRIRIENVTVQPGPVITTYEFVPGSGIKVSQIESLADDIALALKAPGVRIIAPVPGKGTVGIEIPNNKPAMVRFSGIIRSKKFLDKDIKLPIAMGKTVVGEVYCADLSRMPHLLIAGATGKGKSVGINTIIASLLYRMHPRDLKFVIIDPKRVEMTLYKALKDHFMAVCPDISETIITEPQNAVTVLKSVVEEMQQRYSILAAAGQRNIADYNVKALSGVLKNKGGYNHRPMPYIVVIIDELADLMMTAGKEVEEPIVRLAQLARAVGIHCVVATQRPSVDVVTGLIKANFPARIAYQVASRIDSRTILDASGAEHLIGNGDMLFNPGTLTKPMRMQNAFISTDEVEAICEHIGNQRGYSSPYMLPSVAGKRIGAGGVSDDRDVLFEDAARIFITLQQASVSTLQRRLKVGYARAARIVDELEMAGIVGPPDGAKGRQVLLSSEAELEAYL